MVTKKRVVSLLLALMMLVMECVSVFAYGSKTADKLSDSEVIVDTKDGTTVKVGDGTIKSVTVKAPTGSKAEVVISKSAIANAINQVATGTSKMVLPEAKQAGSKFKGYQIIVNGKPKIVKKLTAKILAKAQVDANGNLVMTPVFKVQKFKVKIKTVKINGVKIKCATFSKLTYDSPAQLAQYSASIKSALGAGYELAGYTTVKGGNTVQIKPDEVIYWTKTTKSSITLYPVFQAVKK